MRKWLSVLLGVMMVAAAPFTAMASSATVESFVTVPEATEITTVNGGYVFKVGGTTTTPANTATVGLMPTNSKTVLANGTRYDMGSHSPGTYYDTRDKETLYLVQYDEASKSYKPVTKTENKTMNLSIKANYSKSLVKNVKLAYNSNEQAYLQIEMADRFVGVDSRNWRINVRLYKNNSHINGGDIVLQGTLENESQEVDGYTNYLFLSDEPVLNVTKYVSKAELELDYGILVNTRLFNGKKYYLSASNDISRSDENVFAKYPAINYVYTLSNVGIIASNTTVTIDRGDGDYVYNEKLEYLGRTGEKLSYSNKYYVTAERLSGTGNSSSSSGSSSSSSSSSSTSTETKNEKSIRQLFNKYYKNTVKVGDPVNVSGMNTKNLVFYAYNINTNKFTKLSNPSFQIENGVLTYLGKYSGYLVVSEGTLKK